MDVVWAVVGVLLLLLTLLDAFLAVLNYDEAGLFVDRIVRAQWLVLRAVTRRVGRRWRPLVLRQVTGVIIVVTILWCALATYVIARVAGLIVPMRVDAEAEHDGLDLSSHGERAYEFE